MPNNMASLGLWDNVIPTKINTYHIWNHWMCKERHLVPRCKAPKSMMLQDPCISIVGVVDTVYGSPVLPGGLVLWVLCSRPS